MFGRKKIVDEVKEGKEEKKERKRKEKEEKKFMKIIKKGRKKMIEEEEKEEKKRKKREEKEEKEREKREEKEEKEREKPFAVYAVEYIGGHPKYPKKGWTDVCLFEEYMTYGHQIVPYKNIKRIGNTTDEHITGERVFWTGPIIGLLWKKKFLYTIIDYIDSVTGEEIYAVIDFHGKVDQAQAKIYDKMMAARDGKIDRNSRT